MGFVMWIICCIQIISFRKKWCNFYTQTPIRCNTIKIIYLCKCNGRLLPIVHRRYSKYLLGSNIFQNKRYISAIYYIFSKTCAKKLCIEIIFLELIYMCRKFFFVEKLKFFWSVWLNDNRSRTISFLKWLKKTYANQHLRQNKEQNAILVYVRLSRDLCPAFLHCAKNWK